jgi:hypothetical protein
VKSYGHELAVAVVDAAAKIQTSVLKGLPYTSETLTFPSRWSPKALELQKQPDRSCGAHWFMDAYPAR